MRDIVLLTVDSLRADHIGWHGYDGDTTPFLDEVAADAHTFENAVANGCFTRRSFPSIMTSTYASMYGGAERLSEEQIPIAERLRDEGYATAGFHSNPHLLPRFGYERGFDEFYDSQSEPSKLARLRQWVKDTIPHDSLLYRTLDRAFATSEETVGFNPGTPFVPADDLTDLVIEWVEAAGDGPRFLWVHYMDVHHPYSPPAEHQRPFRDDPIGDRRAVKLRRKMVDTPGEVTESELSDLHDLYDGEIRFVDAEVERLLERIGEEWGTDPVVAFTSDHGDEFRDHGRFGHYDTYYEELVHVPLLLDVGDGSGSHEDVVELLDVPPTLLDCADVPSPESYEGESVLPVVDGDATTDGVAMVDGGTDWAYRDDRWKYIERGDDRELYDLRADPAETENVVEEHPERTAEFSDVVARYRQKRVETDEDLEAVELDGEVQDRLEQLGYLQDE